MQVWQLRWRFLAKRLMNFSSLGTEVLRKSVFSPIILSAYVRVSFESPTENFLRKAENFSLCVRQGFKIVWNFEKFSRLFPCGSHYSSWVWNCLNGQRVFSSDTPAERLWLKAEIFHPRQIFFPYSPKDFPSSSKSDKKKSTFWKKFSKFSSG